MKFGWWKKDEVSLVLRWSGNLLEGLVFQKAGEKVRIISRDFADKKPKKIILLLPPNRLKAKIVSVALERKHWKKIIDRSEEKNLWQEAESLTEKKIEETCFDPGFTNLRIFETKIDGYRVPLLSGYNGKRLEFKILAVFAPKIYLEETAAWQKRFGFKNVKLAHLAEGLLEDAPQGREGIFVNAGLETTTVFLRRDKLEGVGYFEMGARDFANVLCEKFGLREDDGFLLKERYVKKDLSEESLRRLREMFEPQVNAWFDGLQAVLKDMGWTGLLPSDIILFGEGYQLPDVENRVSFLQPQDLSNIEDKNNVLKDPSDTPFLLMCHAEKNN